MSRARAACGRPPPVRPLTPCTLHAARLGHALVCVPRRRRMAIDPDKLRALMEQRVREVGAVARGVYDSGRGVRIQGGRVYDSKLGKTCHYCRQKVVCEMAACTAEGCTISFWCEGGGRGATGCGGGLAGPHRAARQ